ncbi:asparagine synthetase domain-containing protein 1 isoform X1 [Hydra vulgaris]|uniref:asparagine synthetase domain-containing protein 1 isoform X1 n=1 Tax=Hydra vulgaris TaxID=6087 RepID=UPI001F5EF3D7|nr:asparagine synthetase domain-containing protein 1 [Hydra vulgaris]
MCGIFCEISIKSQQFQQHVCPESIHKSLSRRGPDVSGSCAFEINIDSRPVYLSFAGYVLHLRGNLTKQPIVSSFGDVLLWNGEIFGGKLTVDEFANDTEVLMKKLLTCSNSDEIVDILSSVNGPRAFIYYQDKSKLLWYGRDCFGRRSLLSCIKQDSFVLSSVGSRNLEMEFEEVPAKNIYCLHLSDIHEKPFLDAIQMYPLSLLPHKIDNTLYLYEHRCLKPIFTENQLINNNFQNKLLRFFENLNIEFHDEKNLPSVCCCLAKLIHLSSDNEFPKNKETSCKCCLCENETFFDRLRAVDKVNASSSIKYCSIELLQSQFYEILLKSVRTRVNNLPRENFNESCDKKVSGFKKPCVGILFSGGIDSVVLASLADLCVPKYEPIDLINVAFQQHISTFKLGSKKHQTTNKTVHFDVPDRISGRLALKELPTDRVWNFIEVDVTLDELKEERKNKIADLVYPLDSVLDDSIGCALWFAARGIGKLYSVSCNNSFSLIEEYYESPVKVLLCGMGADEQLGGYSRHRSKYESSGWDGLAAEMHMELDRISSRNLGRDDRCISDHGREVRFPFLDENVVSYLSKLPTCVKCDPRLPRGFGEKILLRELAGSLGLRYCSSLPKRAIQFGSKIAKIEGSKEKGAERCDRLK